MACCLLRHKTWREVSRSGARLSTDSESPPLRNLQQLILLSLKTFGNVRFCAELPTVAGLIFMLKLLCFCGWKEY